MCSLITLWCYFPPQCTCAHQSQLYHMQRSVFSHSFEMVSCIVEVWTWCVGLQSMSVNILLRWLSVWVCEDACAHERLIHCMKDRPTEKKWEKQKKNGKKCAKQHNISTNIISQLPTKTLIDQEKLETGLFLWLEWLFRCRRHLGKICGSINSRSTPIQKH